MTGRSKRWLAWGLLLAVASGCATSVARQWAEQFVARSWVTAFTRTLTRHSPSDPFIVQVVVRAGAAERVVYQAQPTDWNVSQPVLSRDGTWLAFLRREEVDGKARERLYAMDADGSNLRLVDDFGIHPSDLKWTYYHSPHVAWAHDNTTLAIERPRFGPTMPGRELVLIDVRDGTKKPLLPVAPSRPEALAIITSQAWAPDNRRLVYTNDEERMTIHDTISGREEILGPGLYPAWSADGRAVAFKLPSSRHSNGWGRGDYFVMALEAPDHRRLLLENLRHGFYFGPALWSADGRYVVVWRSKFEWRYFLEVERIYVQDTATGRIEQLPSSYITFSLGGAP